MKVLISDSIAADGVKKLQDEGIEVVVKTGMPADELKGFIADFDAIIVRSATKVTREIIEAGAKLKVIGRAGVGLDNVDKKAAEEKGIKVVNTPGATSISVAELALGMMFAASRFIVVGTETLRQSKWEKKKYEGTELFGKTLGVIGCGRIGRELAKRAHALGMTVIGSDLAGQCDLDAAKDAHIEMVAMDELFAKADYISLHIPLTPETKYLVNAAALAKMKKGCIVVNCARGGTIDENALYEALKEGKIRGAALDVFEVEPVTTNKLFELPNVIGTPHIGAATQEGQTRAGIEIAEIVAANLKALAKA